MDFKIKMLPALFLTGLLVSCNTFPASAEKSEKKSEKKVNVRLAKGAGFESFIDSWEKCDKNIRGYRLMIRVCLGIITA